MIERRNDTNEVTYLSAVGTEVTILLPVHSPHLTFECPPGQTARSVSHKEPKMKARGTVTAFAALVAAAISGAQAADETVRLTGRCVDESGTPIADVVVSVRHQAEANNASRSAADGSFIIDVPRRSFDGVLLTASDEKGDRLAAVVHPDRGRGDEKQDLRIVLRKAHKLDVTVTDAQGELVTGRASRRSIGSKRWPSK